MKKKLELNRVSSELLIELTELDCNDYEVETREKHDEEDRNFYHSQVAILRRILLTLYKLRFAPDEVLLDSNDVEQLICILDRHYDMNVDYERDETFISNEDEKNYVRAQNIVIKNIILKLYELELTNFQRDVISKKFDA